MAPFKVFYSWQSDFPKTRSFIRKCIDEAIFYVNEAEAIEAERDEATLGETGAPDIVSTVFSKIEDCDLFIADLSLCFQHEKTNDKGEKLIKLSPNPNVLLETGYAAHALGWNRVICLCDTSFGDSFPFDIDHNRRRSFCLDNKNGDEERKKVVKYIVSDIQKLKDQPSKTLKGIANHVLGEYDYNNFNVVNLLHPIDFNNQKLFLNHSSMIKKRALELFEQIQSLNNMIEIAAENNQESCLEITECTEGGEENTPAMKAIAQYLRDSEVSAVWENVDADKKRIKSLLKMDVGREFFDLGRLKKVKSIIPPRATTFKGTDEEIEKENKLTELSYLLLLLDVRNAFFKSFEGLWYIPLAIKNVSSTLDKDIRIVVHVDKGDIVGPSGIVFDDDFKGMQGLLCCDEDNGEAGAVDELFELREDGTIHVELPQYCPPSFSPPVLTDDGFMRPLKTEEDFMIELEQHIAVPKGSNYYEFEVSELKAKECKWMSEGMLIRPQNGMVRVHYQIHSNYSSGELKGVLECKQ